MSRVAFAPGETSKTFPVLVTDNFAVDGDRNVLLYLINPNGMELNQSISVLIIADNETDAPSTNPLELPTLSNLEFETT